MPGQIVHEWGPWIWIALAVLGFGVLSAFGLVVFGLLSAAREKTAVQPKSSSLPALVEELCRPSFLPAAAPERRQETRRVGGTIAVEIADVAGKVKPYRGWVVDRSCQGLSLGVWEELPENTILKIRPVQSGEPLPWFTVVVRNRRLRGGAWEVGCQYLHAPNATALLLLG